jgi:gas vesicle protein
VAGVAKEQAAAVKDTAVDKGQQVVEVAKDEVSKVTAQASGQVKDLLSQGRSQLSEQVSTQQHKLSELVHSFADELGTMAAKSDKSGPLTDLAQQGSRRIGALAHQLETSDASDLLDQVRTFARRRPAAFLLGSALAGVVVGRLSRSLASEAHDAKIANETPALPASAYGTTTAPVSTGYETGAYTTGGYETGSYDAGYTATRAYDGTVGGYVEPGQGDLPR